MLMKVEVPFTDAHKQATGQRLEETFTQSSDTEERWKHVTNQLEYEINKNALSILAKSSRV